MRGIINVFVAVISAGGHRNPNRQGKAFKIGIPLIKPLITIVRLNLQTQHAVRHRRGDPAPERVFIGQGIATTPEIGSQFILLDSILGFIFHAFPVVLRSSNRFEAIVEDQNFIPVHTPGGSVNRFVKKQKTGPEQVVRANDGDDIAPDHVQGGIGSKIRFQTLATG